MACSYSLFPLEHGFQTQQFGQNTPYRPNVDYERALARPELQFFVCMCSLAVVYLRLDNMISGALYHLVATSFGFN